MNDRSELYAVFDELLRRMPDMRFGQLVCNVSHRARGYNANDVWEVEDEQLLTAAREWLAGLAADAPSPVPLSAAS